ncbi:MAG: Lpg1974 family pore-forming outer membrane protein [Legionellaceae bacterium]|nr:Lpg1974 family pore-forming outer membrane protein [Legionellaceae bacterium]
MIKLKNILIASFIMANNGAAFSGTIDSKETKTWVIGGHALYLKTQVGNNGLQTKNTAAEQDPSLVSTLGLNPGYSFGFQLEGTYHLTKDNDLSINWYRLRYSDSDSHYIEQPGDWPAPFSIYGQTSLSSGDTTVKINNQWDAVNLEYGHRIQFATNDNVRIHAGAQYARVADSTFFSGQLNFSGVSGFRQFNFHPAFNGFGPRVGVDLTHHFESHLTAYINGAVAVLAGSHKDQASMSRVGNYLTSYVNNTLVVPEVDGKIGLAYTHQLAQGELSLDIGWLWVNYIDALAAPVYPVLLGKFGAQGAYFGLKWKVVQHKL